MPEICDGEMAIQCNVLKKLAGEDFSNPPLFESFSLRLFEGLSPETPKKG